MTPGPTGGNTAALQKQIDDLGERMDNQFNELKSMLRSYEERTRKIETDAAACMPVIQTRLDDHEKRLTMKSQQIININEQLTRLMMLYRMVSWVAATFGAALIALIISILTNQVQVVFP